MNNYFLAGTQFRYEGKVNPLGISLIIIGLESSPNDYSNWLETGEWLSQVLRRDPKIYAIGISCLKKAFDLNHLSTSESFTFMEKPPENGWDSYPIGCLEMFTDFKIEITTQKLIQEFNQIGIIDYRVNLIKNLADTRDERFLDFLKYCILTDPDYNIRAAALKRIPNFKEIGIRELFYEIVKLNRRNQNEPFFSLALSEIDEPWTDEVIDSVVAKKVIHGTEISKMDFDNSLNDSDLKNLVQNRLSSIVEYRKLRFWCEKGFWELINKRFTYNLSDLEIYNFQAKNVLDSKEDLTLIGVEHIKKYCRMS